MTSSTFYDVICSTERHDQFEHSNCSKKHFCERCIFIHECISIRGCALFFLWNSPHHGRHKAVEIKGSKVRYNKINVTFPDWVIVENIISRNMIINLGCALVDNHIPRHDIFDYHPIRECTIYIILTLFEGCLLYSERKRFQFYLNRNAILRLQILSRIRVTSASYFRILHWFIHKVDNCNVKTNLICNGSLCQQIDIVKTDSVYVKTRDFFWRPFVKQFRHIIKPIDYACIFKFDEHFVMQFHETLDMIFN